MGRWDDGRANPILRPRPGERPDQHWARLRNLRRRLLEMPGTNSDLKDRMYDRIGRWMRLAWAASACFVSEASARKPWGPEERT